MKRKFLLLFVAAALLGACNKNDDSQATSSSNEARIDYELDVITDDVALIAEEQYFAAQSEAGKIETANLPDCASVTVTTAGNTWTRLIYFGTGCEMPNGNILSGVIIINGINDFDAQQTTISYTFEGFYHNNRLVEGSRTIIRGLYSTDANPDLHPVANIDIDLTVTYPNGNVYTRYGNRVREFVAGFDTPDVLADNVFHINGAWTTTFPNGTERNSEVMTPLIKRMDCPRIVSGVLHITRNDNLATLDYGDGTCDNLAILTINGQSTTITLGN